MSCTGFGQTNIFNPDAILVGTRKQPQVLLAGSFHFAYYNLDVVKTAADKQINILSDQKQREAAELVNYIARFKPTKIFIEGWPGDTIAMATPIAHKGTLAGAKATALTLIDLFTKPALVTAAKDYFKNVRTKDTHYIPFLSDKDPVPVYLNQEKILEVQD